MQAAAPGAVVGTGVRRRSVGAGVLVDQRDAQHLGPQRDGGQRGRRGLLGVFELRDFAVPEAIPDYINVALSIAPTAGLAIANARAMRGIIPICGYCKKIRDEGGEWWALESYMTRHSDARFSHGVCPTCLEQQLDAEGLSR